jgi:hypothetical protein
MSRDEIFVKRAAPGAFLRNAHPAVKALSEKLGVLSRGARCASSIGI